MVHSRMRFHLGLLQRNRHDVENIQRPLLVLLSLVTFGVGYGLTANEIHARDSSPIHRADFTFTDDFERDNSGGLGGDWLDCADVIPDSFEPLGVYDGGVVISDPYTRPGKYAQPLMAHPPEDGKLYPGIGCAYIDTGATSVSVKMVWSGNYGAENGPPLSHVESTPLLYVTPSNPRFGFGAWISQLFGAPVVFVGYISSPPENFEVIATARLPEHETGMPRAIELRAEQPGKITMWVDGKQLLFNSDEVAWVEVDPTMIHSTLHGIAVDAHFVAPQKNIPTIKGIETVTVRSLN